MKQLGSVRDVIDALDGLQAVADLTGCSYKAVSMWSSLGNFPSRTYVVLSAALADRKLKAPPRLWAMVEA